MDLMDQEQSRFYNADVGHPSSPKIVLERRLTGVSEDWLMRTRLGYLDRHLGRIEVPEEGGDGATDLTSVPQLFTWLVPKTGTHLPAALIHDGLTPPSDGTFDAETPDLITQVQADRVFRDAMGDIGTPLVRRWLVWSAVSIPTVATVSKVRAVLAYGGLLLIAVLGWLATLDLLDCAAILPWMGEDSTGAELMRGGAFAVAIPVALSLFWPTGLRKAGIVNGLALALLLHVTVAVGLITMLYQLVEHRHRVFDEPQRWVKIGIAVAVTAIAVVTYLVCR